jgi:hypothetical protein
LFVSNFHAALALQEVAAWAGIHPSIFHHLLFFLNTAVLRFIEVAKDILRGFQCVQVQYINHVLPDFWHYHSPQFLVFRMVESNRLILPGSLMLSVLTCCAFASLLEPHLLSLAPRSGPLIGNTPVTIFGSGFSTSSTTCKFGAVLSPSVVVVNSSVLVCFSPSSTNVGIAKVKVSTDTGVTFTDHSLDFLYFGSIVLTGMVPTQGSILGGQSLHKQLHQHLCFKF